MQKQNFKPLSYLPVLKSALPGFLVFSFTRSLVDFYLLNSAPTSLGRHDLKVLVASVCFEITLSFFTSYYFIKKMIAHNQPENFKFYSTEDLKQLCLEGLRVFAHVTLWSLALILPGIYKLIQYMFVNILVLEDQSYKRGEIDALKTSATMTKGKKWVLTGYILSFFIATEAVKRTTAVMGSYISFIIAGPLLVLIEYSYIFFLFLLYKSLKTSNNDIRNAHVPTL